MLGWHISVFRQTDRGTSPARVNSEPGNFLAVWQTGWEGLRWLDEMVVAGQAIHLGGNGYPSRYTAQAKLLIPLVVAGPPEAHAVWACGEHDIITPHWEGKTRIDRAAADDCQPNEWLLVEAWDES